MSMRNMGQRVLQNVFLVYEESLYERVISEKNAGRQEELGYEYEEHGAKSPSERVFRVFKTS